MTANISKEERMQIYRREGWQCALCSSTQYLQVHHAVPRGRGGTNAQENLICLCSVCHGMVHGIMPNNLGQYSAQEVELEVIEYLADLYPGTWADNAYEDDPLTTLFG